MSDMTPRRPYLVRAFYEWLVDNDLTPHLVVDALLPGVRVPAEFVQDGQIILNVAPRAVGSIEMGNDAITFQARFGGKPHSVIVPIYAVQAIYARENGAGTMFEPEDGYAPESDIHIEEETPSTLTVADTSNDAADADEHLDGENVPPRPKGKPSLRVIK
jgi:stringent starvation protein B